MSNEQWRCTDDQNAHLGRDPGPAQLSPVGELHFESFVAFGFRSFAHGLVCTLARWALTHDLQVRVASVGVSAWRACCTLKYWQEDNSAAGVDIVAFERDRSAPSFSPSRRPI